MINIGDTVYLRYTPNDKLYLVALKGEVVGINRKKGIVMSLRVNVTQRFSMMDGFEYINPHLETWKWDKKFQDIYLDPIKFREDITNTFANMHKVISVMETEFKKFSP